MSKSYRRNTDRRYSDDYEAYSKAEIDYKNHKKEKKVSAALKSKNIDALLDDNDEEDYGDE